MKIVSAVPRVQSVSPIAHFNPRSSFMKALHPNSFVKAIVIAVLIPALALAQTRTESDAIQGAALSSIAKAIGKRAAGATVVIWADSAAVRRRLAVASGVEEASAAQLECRGQSCREPAEGVTVLISTLRPTVREGNATVVVEELRGLRATTEKRWTDRMVHTLNLEKRGQVWTVTTGSTRAPGKGGGG
jgi:hypothetical protein